MSETRHCIRETKDYRLKTQDGGQAGFRPIQDGIRKLYIIKCRELPSTSLTTFAQLLPPDGNSKNIYLTAGIIKV